MTAVMDRLISRVIYGLRNQPEITREQIAQAAEGSLAAEEGGER